MRVASLASSTEWSLRIRGQGQGWGPFSPTARSRTRKQTSHTRSSHTRSSHTRSIGKPSSSSCQAWHGAILLVRLLVALRHVLCQVASEELHALQAKLGARVNFRPERRDLCRRQHLEASCIVRAVVEEEPRFLLDDGTHDAAGFQVLSAAEVAPFRPEVYTRAELGLKGVQLFACYLAKYVTKRDEEPDEEDGPMPCLA